jgi:N utilization substance protein A
VNVDIAALRAIERDKEIPFDTVLEAIETALLTAYRHTDGHQPHARIDIDRKSGLVRVMAQELAEDGAVAREWDDTPEGFGRIAATTARQVIVQRLRDAEHDARSASSRRRKAESSRASSSATRPTPAGSCRLRLRPDRASCRRPSRCRARSTHGERICCRRRHPRNARQQITLLYTSRLRQAAALEVPELVDGSVEIVAVARESGHRSKIAGASTVSGVNPRGVIGWDGARCATMSELNARR